MSKSDNDGKFKKLIALSIEESKKSCDLNTKLGVVIVDEQLRIISKGCNTFPNGIEILDERLVRPTKYDFTEHAERNAIYVAAKHGIMLENSVMFFNCNPIPCTDCTRAVIQSGVRMVVGRDMAQMASKRWDTSLGEKLLKEAGIVIVYLDENCDISRVVGENSFSKGFLTRHG